MRLFPAIFLAGLIGLSLPLHSQADNRLQQQRTLYLQAKSRLDAGDNSVYLHNKAFLQGYPLTPYLTYADLDKRLDFAGTQEIERFITDNADLPNLIKLQQRWMRNLAKEGRWSLFDRHYSESLQVTELDCLAGQSLLNQRKLNEAHVMAEKLWLSGQSRPNACDPLFAAWQAAGKRTDNLIWQRLLLAAEARNTGLAAYLARELPGNPAAQSLLNVLQKPEVLQQTAVFDAPTANNAAIVSLGLRRLIRNNSDLTVQLLNHYKTRLPFDEAQKRAMARDIGILLAKRFDARGLAVFQDFDPNYLEGETGEWHARLLLRLGRWSEANRVISRLPVTLAATPRWQYWLARTEQLANPNSKSVHKQLASLAADRDFYAFLAAEQTGQPYRLNHVPVPVNKAVEQQLRSSTMYQRALEFQVIGDPLSVNREWHHASQRASHDELLALGRLAHEQGWHNAAIRNLGQAKYWDDMVIRFPSPYRNELVSEAKNRGLNPGWVYAITRQESAFAPSVRSHAGAMGLMQLMPATAQETARRYGIPLAHPRDAVHPRTNIQLGTAYLHQVMGQFRNNRILSTAAYNAGPGRVRQWLRNGGQHLPFDVWIETIPFDETRQYVHNVLTYAIIYGDVLGQITPVVERHEKNINLGL